MTQQYQPEFTPTPKPKNKRNVVIGAVLVAMGLLFGIMVGNQSHKEVVPASAPSAVAKVEASAPAPSVEASVEETEEATVEEEEAVEEDTSDVDFDTMIVVIGKVKPTKAELVELRELAHNTCDAIDRGVAKEDMIGLMLGQGITPTSRTGKLTMAAMVVGTNVYCPENRDFFLSD